MQRSVWCLPGITLALLYSAPGGHSAGAEPAQLRFERSAKLAFHQSGVISRLFVQEGDTVDQGDILAELNLSVAAAEAAVAHERASLEESVRVAEKTAEAAALEYRVVKEANARDPQTWPAVEEERRRLASETAMIEVALRQRQLQVAKLEAALADVLLATHRLTAPFPGVINRVQAHPGETADLSRIVCELVDPSSLIAETYIPDAATPTVIAGTPVEFLCDSDFNGSGVRDAVVAGEVIFVDLSVQTIRNVVRVTARIPNPDGRLRAGQPGRLRIMTPTLSPTKRDNAAPVSDVSDRRVPRATPPGRPPRTSPGSDLNSVAQSEQPERTRADSNQRSR